MGSYWVRWLETPPPLRARVPTPLPERLWTPMLPRVARREEVNVLLGCLALVVVGGEADEGKRSGVSEWDFGGRGWGVGGSIFPLFGDGEVVL